MFAIQALAIPPSTVRDLLNFAAGRGALDAAGDIADQAIREWLARAGETPPPDRGPARGYHWKSLFLPEGTQLRVWSREDGSRYAEVIGDQILHAGFPVTPNQFVRMQKGIPRNAWTEISLLLPGETAWKAAHVRRSEQRRTERALLNPRPPQRPPDPAATTSPSPSSQPPAKPEAQAAANPAPALYASRPAPEQALRMPRIPPNASQAKTHAAHAAVTGHGHWWPGAPERRTFARRAEDAFLD